MGAKPVSDAALIADVRRVIKEHGRSLRRDEYVQYGRYSKKTIHRCGGWVKVLQTAGLRYYRHPSDSEVRKDVERVRLILGHVPTWSMYKENGRFDPPLVIRHAKARNWTEAMGHWLGASSEDIKALTSSRFGYRRTAEYLEDVRRLAKKLGHTPSSVEARKHGIPDRLRKRVGHTWNDVCKAAGLSPRPKRYAREKKDKEAKPSKAADHFKAVARFAKVAASAAVLGRAIVANPFHTQCPPMVVKTHPPTIKEQE